MAEGVMLVVMRGVEVIWGMLFIGRKRRTVREQSHNIRRAFAPNPRHVR